jgi:tetratricopeptide (TPR) repeat protein
MDYIQQIKSAFEQRRAVVIVGTGVSIMATDNAPCVSWKGLLLNGKAYCADLGWWSSGIQQAFDLLIAEGDLMTAAQMVRGEMDRQGGAHFNKWLTAALGHLKITHREVLEALHGLSASLVTLNYDPLLELGAPSGVRFDPITPKDHYLCTQFLKGVDHQKVLHLHGYFERPETVILDPVSYAALLSDQFTKAFREAIGFSHTMIYVGCGGTFEDPHFDAFRKWMAVVCKDSGIAHYRLVRQAEHGHSTTFHTSDGIVPIVFGKEHDDLVGFLRSIAPASIPLSGPSRTNAAISEDLQLPPKPATFGRDVELTELLAAILQPAPRPICISAPLGYGKSNLCLAALHHADLEAHFGPRRFFLRLDAVNSCQNLVLAVARAIGLAPDATSDPSNAVIHELRRAPTVLVLDNLETPWEPTDERTHVEHFLGRISNVKGLVLLVSIRGRELPGPLAWQEPVGTLKLLLPDAALAVFKDIALEHASEPQLPALIQELSGWPLPIVLMAHQSRGSSFDTLMERWRTEKTRMLERGTGSSALDSLHISIATSLGSPRMTTEGKRLLRVVAELPDGVRIQDVTEIGFKLRDAQLLVQLGLLFEERGRYNVLPSIRSYLVGSLQLEVADHERLNDHYLTMLAAKVGDKVGGAEGSSAVARLKPEANNIEHLLKVLVDVAGSMLKAAVEGWVTYARFTGRDPSVLLRSMISKVPSEDYGARGDLLKQLGDIAHARSQNAEARTCYEEARPLYRQVGDVQGEANCIRNLGDLALRRSEHATACTRYEEARPLFRQLGNLFGEASCIRCLGDVALARSHHDEARTYYEEALPLYQKLGGLLGEANCIKCLGDIALRRSEHVEARSRYEGARPMYQQVGDVLGEANCIRSLGEIALRQSQNADARVHFEEARLMYQQLGGLLGEANCIKSLGDIALEGSQYDEAQAHYEEARPMYQHFGSIGGEANCLLSLGDIELRRNQNDTARARYDEARAMYQTACDILGEANCLQSLGDIELRHNQHDAASACYEEARPMYQQVGDVLGEANCNKRFGEIALARNQHDVAHRRFQDALTLFAKIPEPYSTGLVRRRLARLSEEEAICTYVHAAHADWSAIGRDDLVDQLRSEFPACFT